MRRKIHNLQAQLDNTPAPSTERVDLLQSLAYELWGTDPERSERLIEESADLSEQLGYERGLVYADFARGISKGLRAGNIEQAITSFLEALQWFETHDDQRGQAEVKSITGTLYWSFGDFARGFESLSSALEIYERIQDVEGQGWALEQLGRFHYDVKDHEQALEHFNRAYELFCRIDEPAGRARTLNGIGNVFHMIGRYEEGFEYQFQSLKLQQSIHNKLGESRTLNDIGLLFQALEDFDAALDYHMKSLDIRQELNYAPGITTTLLDLGNVYLHQKKYDQALEALRRTLELSEKMKALPKVGRAHKTLAQVYKAMGQFEAALRHQEQYAAVEIGLSLEDAGKKLQNLQTAYQVEASKKEAEIYRLTNIELKEKNEQLERTLKQLGDTQAQLLQEGKMSALGKLVAGIAHELNTPLGVIKSGAHISSRGIDRMREVLRADGLHETIPEDHPLRQVINLLEQNTISQVSAAERLGTIVESLKNFTRLDEAHFQKAHIHDGIESTLTLMQHDLKDRIEVVKQFGELPEIYCSPVQLNQAFMHLLMNASQSIQGKGRITITTASNGRAIHAGIADTGKGIPPEHIERLFEPGFVMTGPRVRMRTGLYTTYSIIQRHHGEIRVESEVGKGTTFHISLPADLDKILRKTGATNGTE